MKPKKDFDELRWIRIFSPLCIPKELIEQIKNRDYTVEDFYTYHDELCLKQTKEGPTLNPLSHLYVLADKDNRVEGFTWFTIDALTKDIAINTYSVHPDYWGDKKPVENLANLVKNIRKNAKLNKIYWITDYPKHSERHGFKRSKHVLMEYTGEEENGKDDIRKSGELKSTEP